MVSREDNLLAITKSRDDVNGPEEIFISLHTDNAVLHSEKSLQIKEYSLHHTNHWMLIHFMFICSS